MNMMALFLKIISIDSIVVMLLTGFVINFDNSFVFSLETFYVNSFHQNSSTNGFKIA
jgi:hypothetical protein